jgi:hypothetical protein
LTQGTDYNYYSFSPHYDYFKEISLSTATKQYYAIFFLEDEAKGTQYRQVFHFLDVIAELGGILEVIFMFTGVMVGTY